MAKKSRKKRLTIFELATLADLMTQTIEEKQPDFIAGLHPNELLRDPRYGLGTAYRFIEMAAAIASQDYDLAWSTICQAYGMMRVFDALPPESDFMSNVPPIDRVQ